MVDVKNKSSVTDTMFIASGRSTRHVKAIADNLVTKLKKKQDKTSWCSDIQNQSGYFRLRRLTCSCYASRY